MKETPAEEIDCGNICDEALMNLQLAVKKSNAQVVRDALPRIKCNKVQLLHLFQNLIGNAIKYSRKEEAPRIEISAQAKDQAWIFSVKDNGIGIEEEYYDRIFEVFRRLHGRNEYPGTGIGLAICKKIVERNGGKIWVNSAVGQGSTFYFSIPEKREHEYES